MPITDHTIATIAARLRMPNGTVRMVAEAIEAAPKTAPAPKHKGGGYYLLPDGSTVRGREKAEAVIQSWQTLPI